MQTQKRRAQSVPSLLSLLFIIFFTEQLVAQQTKPLVNSTLQGQVLDSITKEPLPGALVHIEGTTHSVSTDEEGKFGFVTGQIFPYTLEISYIGYEKKKIIASEAKIEILLKPGFNQLNDVVVVGYTTQQRKNLIGSVTKVNPAESKDIPAGGFDAQLQGKVSGVQISSNTGVPGEAVNIRLRGATSINASNDPLYVIDGVFLNTNSLQTVNTGGKATSPIADINPADIESIEVLKDAEATALYGSRGANGVIIITTKRGNFNQKPKVALNLSQGIAKAAKLWELTTGPEHATLVNEYYRNIGQPEPFRPVTEVINGIAGIGLPEEQQTYDRLGEAFRTAALTNVDLSISGGAIGTRYYIGGGYNRQESTLKPISFDRLSFKVNLDQKISDRVQIGTSNTIGRTGRNQARAGDGPQGGLLQAALHTPTYLSPYNDQGVLVGRAGFDNLTLLLENYDVHSTSLRYIGNLYADIQLSSDLKFRSTFSLDYNNYDESEYWNNLLIAGSPNGLATSAIGQSTTWINEQTITYRKKVNQRHDFGILVGNTLQGSTLKRTSATGRGFASNDFKLISSAATTTSSQDWEKYNLASFFGRIDYAFDDKYLIDFSLRADGSSRFGSADLWGYFPAVGAAWRIKRENFLKNLAYLDDLKIRASYGSTGNQNGIGAFAARRLWSGIGSSYQGIPGIAPEQLANSELRWERTDQLNIGLDATLFKQALDISFNWYRKYTKDGLLPVTLAATTGYDSYTSNAAEISNKGLELALVSRNIRKTDFSWQSSFNIARNVNKIEKLENPLNYGSRDLILFQEGHPLYSFWVYNQLYVDPQTGDVVYEDVNEDGRITVADRKIMGSIWPDFYGGLTNNFTFKGFDANIFFVFSYGNEIYNHNRFFGEAGGARDAARVIFASNLDRWQQPGDITDVPRSDGVNVNNYKDGGSRWLEDGSYLRLRSLTIGYTLPKHVTDRWHLDRLRFYLQGNNLFTWTKYSGLDPEAAASSDPNEQGIDLGTPPQPRSFQLGINLAL
ncbi:MULTISPECIES: SusC/RagA family TonB-linked outer membrane protein [Olivibacter]|jgi:TonB-linked SusC/RagA family outer membrane protein|uniref:SusC/RagA family TonB-linked outer membrane protein n=1 Tax=Olivibacter oleidegradans TaxID=760123 RepID=A0ABV6HNV9_9SPHI|nr:MULTISPECIES: TonB-dependent receptor [Olivibacter]MDM8173556.1 TonB-dependent receptor [Olivibacter sp. 47]QEL03272.1 TonB-dependent receptor [Olivibacter sp. LS-1]